MEQIEKVELLTKKEKMILSLKNFLQIRVTAYAVSTAAAFGVGNAVQNYERSVTGYDPVSHASEIEKSEKIATDDFGKFKKEAEAKEKRGLLEWSKDILEKTKQGILNPREFIQNTEMYRTMHLKYLSTLKFVDDASFVVPALLMFVMLGGFLSRKLEKIKGDVAEKEDKARLAAKINELVDFANDAKNRIEAMEGTPL